MRVRILKTPSDLTLAILRYSDCTDSLFGTNWNDITSSPVTVSLRPLFLEATSGLVWRESLLKHVCFSSYSFRQAHHVRVRGRPLREWWRRLNYICRPHGVRTSILFWRPINKKDYGMSLLNHSVIFFFLYLFSPLSPTFLEVTSSCSWPSLPSCSARGGRPQWDGDRGSRKRPLMKWGLLSSFSTHPGLQQHRQLCVKGTWHCCGQAANIPPSQFSHSHFTINLFSKSTKSSSFVC